MTPGCNKSLGDSNTGSRLLSTNIGIVSITVFFLIFEKLGGEV